MISECSLSWEYKLDNNDERYIIRLEICDDDSKDILLDVIQVDSVGQSNCYFRLPHEVARSLADFLLNSNHFQNGNSSTVNKRLKK